MCRVRVWCGRRLYDEWFEGFEPVDGESRSLGGSALLVRLEPAATRGERGPTARPAIKRDRLAGLKDRTEGALDGLGTPIEQGRCRYAVFMGLAAMPPLTRTRGLMHSTEW